MKKMFFLLAALCFTLSACMPAILQPQAAANPAPLSDADIQATVALSGTTNASIPANPYTGSK